MASPKSDLYVITKAKELAKYVVVVTEKSPKKYRFTLVVRLQNYCLDILEHLLLANTLSLQDPARLSHFSCNSASVSMFHLQKNFLTLLIWLNSQKNAFFQKKLMK